MSKKAADNSLDDLRSELDEAIGRIDNLEAQVVFQSATTAESAQKNGARKEMSSPWRYLIGRSHPWRRQLCIKGRNLTVGQLISTIHANKLTAEQAAADLELPAEAIQEALAYYSENLPLIELEAAEERRRLADRGYSLEPKQFYVTSAQSSESPRVPNPSE